MNPEQEKQLEKALEDDQYALEYAKAGELIEKSLKRIYHSPFRLFWRLYYRIRGI